MMYDSILETLNRYGARLVAVSKNNPPARIQEVYQRGQRIFGENRVQELLEKQSALPADIEWHLIGHLQTNKVKYIAPFVSMIHSIDSWSLLEEVNKQAVKNDRIQDVLLQFHVAQEESKFGLKIEDAVQILENPLISDLKNVRICGIMGMATFSDDMALVRSEFRQLRQIFERLKTQYFTDQTHFREISMGMSGDWRIALEEGSTMVRIGSLIFPPA
ncbi:MAG: YggS family pyridoxal phosphate-dependent enzyme [Saprospiraceae bacterium]|nr:YggS family pyridoxal phosphate-dependent enzyme [Saprospiraceae bacterium]